MQAPLKERYEDDPETALVTLRATARSARASPARSRPGARSPRPGCTRPPAATARALLGRHAARGARRLRRRDAAGGGDVARASRSTAGGSAPRATSTSAARSPSSATRRSASARSVAFELDTDAGDEELETLLKLTERYCVVFQTLSTLPQRSADVRPAEPRSGPGHSDISATWSGPRHATVHRRLRWPGPAELETQAPGAAAGPRDRMARGLRLPARLRRTHALHRPLPLPGSFPRPCSFAARSPSSSDDPRPLPAGAGGGGWGPRRPHPLRPCRRRPGDRLLVSVASPTARARCSS